MPRAVWGRAAFGERVAKVLVIAVQLGALLLLVRLFELESRSVFRVLCLAFGAFLFSALLPVGLRLAWFTAVSLTALPLTLGVDAAVIVVGVGLLLIAASELPVPWLIRVALVAVMLTSLAFLRSSADDDGALARAMPVVASMFMFRLALYLHALRYSPGSPRRPTSLPYFFMLPNACYPLFPVVDYDAFRRSHFDGDEFSIYETGVSWILRGIIHLLLARFVAIYLAIDELAANDLLGVIQQVFTTFLIYLEVSGRFHLIIGVLHLFGFRLPETHQLYLLASSLPDLWRRINIYWKDFLSKLVYYPVFFALRGRGTRVSIVLATIAVFAASWLLHAYQAFWLAGEFRFSIVDASFWAVFAVLVAVIAWRQSRRKQSPDSTKWWSSTRALGTIVTMSVVMVLWSFWYSRSAPTWFFMWTRVQFVDAGDLLRLGLLVTFAFAFAGFNWDAVRQRKGESGRPMLVYAGAVRLTGVLLACALVSPSVSGHLSPGLRDAVNNLRGRGFKARASHERVLGYYGNLMLPPTQGDEWYPDGEQFDCDRGDHIVARQDFLLRGFKPGYHGYADGGRVSVNRWGIRDREYSLEKPPATIRIALLGASDAAGCGVNDSEIFEAILESQLDSLARRHGKRVEILNFSVAAWGFAQQVHAMKAEALKFRPDLVLFTVHGYGLAFSAEAIDQMRKEGIHVPDPALAELARKATTGTSSDDWESIYLRLRLLEDDWYRRVTSIATTEAAKSGAQLAMVALRPPSLMWSGWLKPLERATVAERIPWVDCRDAYDGFYERSLWVGPHDNHPNATAHALIARCLLTRLESHPLISPIVRPHVDAVAGF